MKTLDLSRPLPVRLDVRKNPEAVSTPITIFLNGEEVRHVVAFDVEAGTVARLMMDPLGRPLVIEASDEALIETLTGEVRVEWDVARLTVAATHIERTELNAIIKEFKRDECGKTRYAMAAEIAKLRAMLRA